MLPNFPSFDYKDPAKLQSQLRDALPFLHRLVFDKVMQTASDEQFTVYLVGGIVRDLFLGRPNFDLDFVCLEDAHRLARILSAVFKTLLPVQSVKLTTHVKFGTARLNLVFNEDNDQQKTGTHLNEIHLDIATARIETYAQPAALPDVKFPATLAEDLLRRDFTINAMALTPVSGGLHLTDPFEGLTDLKAGWLRVLHSNSFIDDPTRILRGIRFAARFDYRFEPYTAQLLQKAFTDGYLQRLSAERVRNEFLAMLREVRPEIALQQLHNYNILTAINPLLSWDDEIKQAFQQIRQHWKQEISPAAYLAILCYQLTPAQVQKFGRELRLFDQTEKIPIQVSQLWQQIRPALTHVLTNSQLYRLLHAYDSYALKLFVFLLQLQKLFEPALKVSFYLAELHHIKPQLNGDYLKQKNLKPGPHFRRLLDELQDAMLDGNVVTRADEEAFLQQKISESFRIVS